MICPNCGNKNRAVARFCANCGTHLEIVCPNCNNNNRPGAKYCDNCGFKLIVDRDQPFTGGDRAEGIELQTASIQKQHSSLDRMMPREFARKGPKRASQRCRISKSPWLGFWGEVNAHDSLTPIGTKIAGLPAV